MVSKFAWTLVLFGGLSFLVAEGFWVWSLGMWALAPGLFLVTLGVAIFGLKVIWVDN